MLTAVPIGDKRYEVDVNFDPNATDHPVVHTFWLYANGVRTSLSTTVTIYPECMDIRYYTPVSFSAQFSALPHTGGPNRLFISFEEPALSSDATLSTLTITPNHGWPTGLGSAGLGQWGNPSWDPDITEYSMTINGNQSYTINATASNPAATVTGTGQFTSAPLGQSMVRNIIVVAEDGTTTKIYSINFFSGLQNGAAMP